jgi:hypothetical protein
LPQEPDLDVVPPHVIPGVELDQRSAAHVDRLHDSGQAAKPVQGRMASGHFDVLVGPLALELLNQVKHVGRAGED